MRWSSRPRAAGACVLFGLGWQLLSNEEAYGTGLLALTWCLLAAARGQRPRPALGLALACGAALLVHYLFLQRVPGGAGGVLSAGLAGVPASALERSGALLAGLGLPGGAALGWVPPLFALVPWFAGRRDLALFGLLAWATAFVPFALDGHVPYRAYPSLAPMALLVAGLAAQPLAAAARRRLLAPALGLLVVVSSTWPRQARLEEWREATHEVAICAPLVAAMAAVPGSQPPVLVNLETTTAALVAFHFDLPSPTDLTLLGFLDGASGFVPPADPPAGGRWFGRRLEGSYGLIDPGPYFGARATLPPRALIGELLEVDSVGDALERLGDPGLDLSRVALAETDVSALDLDGGGGEVVELEPFDADPVAITARQVLATRAEGPTVLAIQDPWLYGHGMRISRDQRLFSHVTETRVLVLDAYLDGSAEGRRAFRLNAYGFGIPIPAGEHRVELRWRRAQPGELR